jgi:hypothetical protein
MSSLVLRAKRDPFKKYVIPKTLLKKDKPTWRERLFFLYPELTALFAGTSGTGLAITATATGASHAHEILGIVVAGISMFVGGITAIFSADEGNFGDRKERLRYDYSRRFAPHASDRKSRKRDVLYAQYSVWLERESVDVKIYLCEHTVPARGAWKKHKIRKREFDANQGEWSADQPAKFLNNPSVDDLMDAITDAEISAQAVEEQTYQKALNELQIERLVRLHQAPRSGSRDIAVHRASEDSLL